MGEKPFSAASGAPPTFVIRRRGPFTRALFDLGPGDPLLLRGPYGAAAPTSSRDRAVVIAGGTGIAAAAPVARWLSRRHGQVLFYLGVSRREELGLADALCPELDCRVAADDGLPARVLERLRRELGPDGGTGWAFYVVGPEGFLQRAARAAESLGADPQEVFVCLETPSLCGVGLCGSCECGGRLLCKEGTFLSLAALRAAREGFEAPGTHGGDAHAQEAFIPAGAAEAVGAAGAAGAALSR